MKCVQMSWCSDQLSIIFETTGDQFSDQSTAIVWFSCLFSAVHESFRIMSETGRSQINLGLFLVQCKPVIGHFLVPAPEVRDLCYKNQSVNVV